MHWWLIWVCSIPACLCDNDLKERGTRHSSNLTDDDIRVDDIIMQILQDIRVYKDVIGLNKELRKELKWILQETKGYKEVSRIVNLLKLDMQGTCASNPHVRHSHFKDCSEIKASGVNISGIYTIYPEKSVHVEVYCDMTTDGGGWTRHSGGSLDFQRTWSEYEKGFGDPSGDLWLGNKKMHALTSKKKYELRVDLIDTSYNKKYKQFSTGDNVSKYTLTVSGYSGNAGDYLNYHNGMKFSTKDQDNDLSSRSCVTSYGPWWHGSCSHSALNKSYSSKLYWYGSNIIKSTMMIRRL